MAKIEHYVKTIGEKLKTLLIPLIREEYPEFAEEQIGYVFDQMCGSTEKWYIFMNRWILPNKEMIKSGPREGVSYLVESRNIPVLVNLPQIFPGVSLKPVPYDIYEKVNKYLQFYLNLYELVDV